MTTPGVWSPQDLDHILGRYGSMIVERAGSDVQNALSSLTQWKDNIFVIPVCRLSPRLGPIAECGVATDPK